MRDILRNIDKDWTLFLDRDGVLNQEINGDYVRNLDQCKVYDYVPDVIAKCSKLFGKIVVVTNQRGIGKGLYTKEDLLDIHQYIQSLCQAKGGYIDAFYNCDAIHSDALCRKPNIGMALQAQKQFPEIYFPKSIMIGNNLSDMAFGKNAGMHTIFLETTSKLDNLNSIADLVMPDLKAFAKAIN